jgi:hypothetical protein
VSRTIRVAACTALINLSAKESASLNRTYLIVPLVSLAAFTGYYVYWKAQPTAPAPIEAKSRDDYAGRDGKKEAEAELATGKLVVIETGPGVSWDAERREIALTNYGVELRRIDGPATETFARYVDAFNRVMRPKVLSKHGRGFFDTLHQEAIALQDARRARKDSRGR